MQHFGFIDEGISIESLVNLITATAIILLFIFFSYITKKFFKIPLIIENISNGISGNPFITIISFLSLWASMVGIGGGEVIVQRVFKDDFEIVDVLAFQPLQIGGGDCSISRLDEKISREFIKQSSFFLGKTVFLNLSVDFENNCGFKFDASDNGIIEFSSISDAPLNFKISNSPSDTIMSIGSLVTPAFWPRHGLIEDWAEVELSLPKFQNVSYRFSEDIGHIGVVGFFDVLLRPRPPALTIVFEPSKTSFSRSEFNIHLSKSQELVEELTSECLASDFGDDYAGFLSRCK